MKHRQCASGHDQAIVRAVRESRDGALHLAGVPHINWGHLYAKCRRHCLDRGDLALAAGNGGVAKDCYACHARGDFLEQLQPFSTDAVFELDKSGRVTARPRQTVDEAGADRIGNKHEYDRHRAGCLQQRRHARSASGQYDIWIERDQFGGVSADAVGIARIPAMFYLRVLAYGPAQLRERLREGRVADLPFRIVRGQVRKHADAPHPLCLLRARRHWPRRRPAEQRDELAALHSITSSAVASSVGGTASPSILAVSALITSSNLLACITGKSAGFAPLRMRPA